MHRRHGFSLVEMAIVIIIIGLLLGGLVAGRNYIKNAELTSLVNEGKFYINVFEQFREQYNAIPGDFVNTDNQLPNAHGGDGNGYIEFVYDNSGGYTGTTESLQAFEHLNRAKLIDGNYTGDLSSGNFVIGTNLPRSSFSGATWMFDHPLSSDGDANGSISGGSNDLYYDGMYGHVLIAAGMLPTSASPPNTPMLTPRQTLSLDIKYDDGLPGTGWMTVPTPALLANCASSALTSAVYLTGAEESCYIILKVQ